MNYDQITDEQRRWNFITLAQFRVVAFDYETQRYKVRCKNDKTLEHWIDAEIIESIDYFKEDAAYCNTNEAMAKRAERKRLYMALVNPQAQQEEDDEKSGSSGKNKAKIKPF